MDKKILLIPSLVLLSLVLWLVLFYLPLHHNASVLKKRLTTLEEKERSQISQKEIQKLENVVDSLSSNITKQMEKIYPEEKLLDLGRAMETIGKKYNLNLISITPDLTSLSAIWEATNEISELPISIEFQGQFMQVAQFLDGIPEFPFLLQVKEISLKREEKEGRSLIILIRGAIVLRKERLDESTVKREIIANKA